MHPQTTREFSSAGLEHLPYKQRVGGSNPSTPTRTNEAMRCRVIDIFLFYMLWCKLACRQMHIKQKKLLINSLRSEVLVRVPAASGTKRRQAEQIHLRSSQSVNSHKTKTAFQRSFFVITLSALTSLNSLNSLTITNLL